MYQQYGRHHHGSSEPHLGRTPETFATEDTNSPEIIMDFLRFNSKGPSSVHWHWIQEPAPHRAVCFHHHCLDALGTALLCLLTRQRLLSHAEGKQLPAHWCSVLQSWEQPASDPCFTFTLLMCSSSPSSAAICSTHLCSRPTPDAQCVFHVRVQELQRTVLSHNKLDNSEKHMTYHD